MKDVSVVDVNGRLNRIHDSQIIGRWLGDTFSNRLQCVSSQFSKIIAGAAGAKSFRDVIEPSKIYVAKFPKYVLDKINADQYEILQSKAGDLLATIIDKTAPANKNFVHQLRLEEMNPAALQSLQNLATNITNIAIQNQLAEINEILSEIRVLAFDIKRGQVLDRIAYINSGKDTLEQALLLSADDPMQKQLIAGAIISLNMGRNQIYSYLCDELKHLPPIPQSKFMLMMKCMFNQKFYPDMDNKFLEMQESFQSYIYGTNLLAAIYERTGHKDVLTSLYKHSNAFIRENAGVFLRMSSIVLDGKTNVDKQWFSHPDAFISSINDYSKHALLDDVEYITVELSGEQLMLDGGLNE